MIRVLALDPGERVGWNTALITEDDLTILDYGIMTWKRMALALHETDDGGGGGPMGIDAFDVVIYETWVLTAAGAKFTISSDMPSSQFIGVVRTLGWLHPEVTVIGQAPRKMNTGLLALHADRPDYAAINQIIDAAPARHDDSHYVSSILHTVAYYHREHA